MNAGGSGGLRQKILLAASVVLLIGAGVYAWRYVSGGTDYRHSAERAFKCSECGLPFDYTIKHGDMAPYKCPDCGKQTGYPAEMCFWTKGADGEWEAKLDPTYVILKKAMGIDEQTYCPDCGREVTGHNKRPPEELMAKAREKAGQ